MGKHYGMTVEEHYKSIICPECIYTRSCLRGLYPEQNEEAEMVTLKCAYYVRRLANEDEIYYILTGQGNEEHNKVSGTSSI